MMARKRPNEQPVGDPLGPIGAEERRNAHDLTQKLEAMVGRALSGTRETQAAFLVDVFQGVQTLMDALAKDVASRHSVDLLRGPAAWWHLADEAFDYVLERYCHAKTLWLTLDALSVTIVTAWTGPNDDLRQVVEMVRPIYSEIGARGLFVWLKLARTDASRQRALAKIAAPTIGRLSMRNKRLLTALRDHHGFRPGLISEAPGAIVMEIDEAFRAPSKGLLVTGRPRNAPKPFLINLRNAVARHIERQHRSDGIQFQDMDDLASQDGGEPCRLPVDADRPALAEKLTSALSTREREVAELLIRGMRPTDIARRMGVTRQRVNTLKHHIADKIQSLQ